MSEHTTWTTLRRAVNEVFVEKVERDHQQSDAEFRRRRIVVVVTLVIGATLLGISLNVRPGDNTFYPLTFGVAVVWTVGGFLSGPLHLGYLPFRGSLRRPVLVGLLLGVGAVAVFYVGALLVRLVPPLHDLVAEVLAHAVQGSLPLVWLITLVNGLAEEVFFRGGLFAAIGRKHPVVISSIVYALATVVTGNLMLVFAALVLAPMLALLRRSSGGILAPMITHVVWSTSMLFLLPPLFR